MKRTYKLDACHPIFARVIESNLDEDALQRLHSDLTNAGYDDIKVDPDHIIYEDGDTIEVTIDMFFALPDDPDKELEVVTFKDRKLAECKQMIKYIYGDNPKGDMVGSIYAHRLGRDNGHLSVKWHNAENEEWQHTNVYWLEAFGFEFEHPEFEKIPLRECDDDLLGDHERVIKYLMLQFPEDYMDEKGLEKEVSDYMKPLLDAMNKAGCVFYRP